MSPRLSSVKRQERDFIEGVFRRVGRRVEGEAYLLPLANGKEHVAVVTPNSIVSSQELVDGLTELLTGGMLFQVPRSFAGAAIPETLIPETKLEDIILQDPNDRNGMRTRVLNTLKRSRLTTVGEVTAILDQEDGQETLKSIKDFGDKSLDLLLQALGRVE